MSVLYSCPLVMVSLTRNIHLISARIPYVPSKKRIMPPECAAAYLSCICYLVWRLTWSCVHCCMHPSTSQIGVLNIHLFFVECCVAWFCGSHDDTPILSWTNQLYLSACCQDFLLIRSMDRNLLLRTFSGLIHATMICIGPDVAVSSTEDSSDIYRIFSFYLKQNINPVLLSLWCLLFMPVSSYLNVDMFILGQVDIVVLVCGHLHILPMPSRFSGSNDASIPGWHMSYHLLGQSSSTVGLYINICCFKESTSQGLIWRMGFFSIAENLCVYSCHHVICWSCCHGWFDQILIWYWLVFYPSQVEEKHDDNIVWCLSFRHMSSYFKVSRSSFDIVVCWSSTVTRSQFVVQNIHLFILNLTCCWIFLLTRLGWCIYSGVLTATGASSILDTAATTLPGGPISLTCHLACLGTIPAKKKY
jgi:hypothetical protein